MAQEEATKQRDKALTAESSKQRALAELQVKTEEARRNAGQLGDQTPGWVKALLAIGVGLIVLQSLNLVK